jgi:hypothetical protein
MRTEATRMRNSLSEQTFGSLCLIRLALAIVGLAFAVAPGFAQQLDPVKGPMSLQAPGPFFEGSKGAGTYSYSIKSDFGRVRSWTYTDGEKLKGKCESVTAPSADANALAAADSNPPLPNLASVWDLVNGPGYYASHVQGNKIIEGTFKGDKGTILEVESLDHFVAVGEDNRGNLYKIVW